MPLNRGIEHVELSHLSWRLGRFAFISWKVNQYLVGNRDCFFVAYAQLDSTIIRNYLGTFTETSFIFEQDVIGKNVTFQLVCYERLDKVICQSQTIRSTVGGDMAVREVKAIAMPSNAGKVNLRWSVPHAPVDGYIISVKKQPFELDYKCTFHVQPVVNGCPKTYSTKSNNVTIHMDILRKGADTNNNYPGNNGKLPVQGLSLDYVYGKIQATWGESQGAESYDLFLWTSDLTKIKHVGHLQDTQYEFIMEDPFTYGAVVFCCVTANFDGGNSSTSKWETISIIPIPPSNWEEIKFLGRGQFGTVHLVRDIEYNYEIAKKTLKKCDLENDQDGISKEINFMSMLSHPRIIQYFGSKETHEAIHIFMEYMPRGSLRDVIRSTIPMDEDRIKFYSRQILEGIHYLHNKPKPILHRDVKALNVLIDAQGNAKLSDFGCSKLTKVDDMATSFQHNGTSVGSPYWMSPEVIKNEGYGRLCDIWSVGCTIVEMFTGNPPWYKFERLQAIYKIATTTTEANLPSYASEEAKVFLSECIFVSKDRRWYAHHLLNHPWLRTTSNTSYQPPLPIH